MPAVAHFKNLVRYAVVCLFALVSGMLATPAATEARDLFEVGNIAVDARDKSATAARQKAIKQGQIEAFDTLLQRITRRQDWPVLPKGADSAVENYVLSFRVQNEKNSNRRYLATLSFQFDMNRIVTLLNQVNIPYIETQAKPALIVPLLEDVTGYRLWEQNWWQESWRSQDIDSIPAPLVLATGDTEDASNLDVEDILLGDTSSMATIAARYNADAVIVVHANAAEVGRLDVAVYQYTSRGSRLFFRNFTGSAEPRDMASQAVQDIAAAFSDEWKDRAIISADDMATFTVAADYDRMDAWLKMLHRLETASFIKGLDLHVVTSKGAIMSLSYTGSVDQLAANLAQNDMYLKEDASGWRLKLRR
ncbi:MAG: DUF2066 domain-containing protein [Parvibaculales bacterium]